MPDPLVLFNLVNQQSLATLQSNVSTLNSQVSTDTSNISTLNGQVNSDTSSISSINNTLATYGAVCRLKMTASISIGAAATWIDIGYDTVIEDTANAFSATNRIWTCPTAGLYWCESGWAMQTVSTTNAIAASVFQNPNGVHPTNNPALTVVRRGNASSNASASVWVSGLVRCAKGDTLAGSVWISDTPTVTGQAGLTYLNIYKVSA